MLSREGHDYQGATAAASGNRAAPVSDNRSAADLYETPEVYTRALLSVERFAGPIWEPAAGRGAISRVLADAGHEVVSTDLYEHEGRDDDIATGIDFLTAEPAIFPRVIVTNPPFSIAHKFVERVEQIGADACLLLPLNFYARRTTPALDRLAAMYVMSPRGPRLHRDGWEGSESGATMNLAWFVFVAGFAGATAARRIYWREIDGV